MIKGMTAFGRGLREGEKKDITVEIKSVNSRFFDCNVKMPRIYLALEEKIKSYIKQNAVARAKVDVYITVQNKSGATGELSVDTELAASYLSALRGLAGDLEVRDDVTVSTLVRLNPEILRSANPEETESAKTETTGLHNFDFFGKTVLFKLLGKSLLNRLTARRGTSGTAANKYMCANHKLYLQINYPF